MDDKKIEEEIAKAEKTRRSSFSGGALLDPLDADKPVRVIYEDSIVSQSTIESEAHKRHRRCGCFCLGKSKIEPLKFNYVIRPPRIKRTVHTLKFIEENYERLNLTSNTTNNNPNDPNDLLIWELANTFQICTRAIRYLKLMDTFSEDSLQRLQFYLEDALPEKQVKLVEERSVIGSFMWLIALSFHSTLQASENFETKFNVCLTEIVNLAEKNWIGITYLVESFIKVRKQTESAIDKYIIPKDAENKYKISNDSDPNRNQLSNKRSRYKDIRKKNLHQLKLYNKFCHPSLTPENPVVITSTFEDLKLYKKPDDIKTPVNWIKFDLATVEEQAEEILNICHYTKDILKDVHINIHFLQKYINQYQDNDNPEKSSSYSEAILFLRRSLKTLSKLEGKKIKVGDDNRLAMVEMGKILEDDLELSEYFLMALRSVVYESRHAVHVVYEYCRLYHHCEIPRYDIASTVDYEKVMEQFRASKDDNADEISLNENTTEELPVTLEEDIKEFQSSPYILILQSFPVNANGFFYQIFNQQEKLQKGTTSLVKPKIIVKAFSHH